LVNILIINDCCEGLCDSSREKNLIRCDGLTAPSSSDVQLDAVVTWPSGSRIGAAIQREIKLHGAGHMSWCVISSLWRRGSCRLAMFSESRFFLAGRLQWRGIVKVLMSLCRKHVICAWS